MSTMLFDILLLVCFFVSPSVCDEFENDFLQRLENTETAWNLAQKTVKTQLAEITHLKKILHDKQMAIDTLKEGTLSKRQSPNTVVGFTAVLSHPVSHLNSHQTIVFDKVLTNVGSSYDSSSGVFTCPNDGLYEFAATVASNGDQKNLDAEMVLDGAAVAKFHATVYGIDMGAQVVIIQCGAGQRVWIRHVNGNHDTTEMPGGYSTFAGHLIHAD